MSKRSSTINLSRMRKGAYTLVRKPLAVAIGAALLAGCSQKQDAIVYKSLDECKGDTKTTVQECEAAYKKAVAEANKTAPKYKSRADCEAEFGTSMCSGGTGNHSSVFMPMMYGYMLGSMGNGSYDHRHSTPIYTSTRSNSRFYGRMTTADGSTHGKIGQKSVRVSKSATAPKPSVTKTMSRGGFGSAAAARARMSSSSSRSGGGWGG